MLEVCVDSLDSAVAAQQGGALRLELCAALSEGGLTPTPGFVKIVKTLLPDIQCFPILRPRCGNFIYSKSEIDCIVEDMQLFHKIGIDGFVFGALNSDNAIDEESCKIIKSNSCNLPLTFHRAFDLTVPKKLEENYRKIENLGFTRILTSGLEANCKSGIERIQKLNQMGNLIIMPGGGIKPDNAYEILQKSKCKEFHASARKSTSNNELQDLNLNTNKIAMGSGKNESENLIITDSNIVRELVNIGQKYKEEMKW